MANITVHKTPASTLSTLSGRTWDPFRQMRELLAWDPFQQMSEILPVAESLKSFTPDFEVKSTDDAFIFKADLPGIKEQDLDVSITGNRLTVSGKREAEKEDKGDTFYTYERSYGSFSRSFTLPDDVQADQCHAELKEGVLTLHLPKSPELQAKKIAVKTPEKMKT